VFSRKDGRTQLLSQCWANTGLSAPLKRHLPMDYRLHGSSTTSWCRRWPNARRDMSSANKFRSTIPTWAASVE